MLAGGALSTAALLWGGAGYLAAHARYATVAALIVLIGIGGTLFSCAVSTVTAHSNRRLFVQALAELAREVEALRVQQQDKDEAWRAINNLMPTADEGAAVVPFSRRG